MIIKLHLDEATVPTDEDGIKFLEHWKSLQGDFGYVKLVWDSAILPRTNETIFLPYQNNAIMLIIEGISHEFHSESWYDYDAMDKDKIPVEHIVYVSVDDLGYMVSVSGETEE